MSTIEVKDITGNPTGTIELSPLLFSAGINPYSIREALCQYLANQRQGTHKTKTRGLVRGGGKKPWKQKGTGRARAGSNRSPLWRHGGTAFGPQPRDYSFKVNKKKKQAAIRSALTDLAQKNKIVILRDINLETPKTKSLLQVLKALQLPENSSTLFLLPEKNDNVYLAGRNLQNVKVSVIENINIFDLLKCDYLITTTKGVNKLEESFV